MKRSIIIVVLFFGCLMSSAQNFSVAADQNNILYVGLDNPLTIAVENSSDKSIIVKTDNGTISGNSQVYIYFLFQNKNH